MNRLVLLSAVLVVVIAGLALGTIGAEVTWADPGSPDEVQLASAPQAPPERRVPDRFGSVGTSFTLANSDYPWLSLDSTEPITLAVEPGPGMVKLRIAPASDATSTRITIVGLAPRTSYHKYQDNYHQHVAFVTDDAATYSYTQDLSEPHRVWIQSRPSTVFLSDSGFSKPVGTWDPASRVAVLTQDVYETIQIDTNRLTLNGNGHVISGTNTGYGIYLDNRSLITITNLTVRNFDTGIYAHSSRITLTNNIVIANTALGIQLDEARSSFLRGNSMSGNHRNFEVYGTGDMHFNYNDIDTSNTVDGKPIYYIKKPVNQTYDASTNAGTMYIMDGDRITLTGLALSKNGNGLFLWNTKNSRIQNLQVSDNNTGIELFFSHNITLTNNTAVSNTNSGISLLLSDGSSIASNTARFNGNGIYLGSSTGNTVASNNASNNRYGVYFSSADDNRLVNNTANSNSVAGIYLDSSNGSTLTGNVMSGNQFNFDVEGSGGYYFDHNVDTSNLVDGKPIYYINGGSNQTIDSSTNAGAVYLVSSSNITVKDLTLRKNGHGVLMWYTGGSRIENVQASYNRQSGISINRSTGNTLLNNVARANGPYGIWLQDHSDDNTLTGNTAISNTFEGIGIDYSSNITLTGNSAISNTSGIVIYLSHGGTLKGNVMSG
ncbi:MAG: right-handed parallel beta-helix repeat-containing protein, partial [Candidatus Marsarchaeota archaeon]|nr:right-handed parallel beta-helix repeat-containing protein [Candidatus Marsarchaeota archaeon]